MKCSITKVIIISLVVSTSFLSCKDEEKPSPEVVTKGNRKMGFHITTSETNDYEKDFQLAKSAGMESIPLTFIWNSIEKGDSWDFTNQDIANLYFPSKNVEVLLTVSPIYAINKALPSDIDGLEFDNATVIARFNSFLDSLHSHMPNVKLTALSLGNEVDLYLGDNEERWQQFKVFFEAARTKAKTLWGASLKVGVESTYSTIRSANSSKLKSLVEKSDVGIISYYPLNSDFTMQSPNSPENDFGAMASFYPEVPIIIEETGYATSEACGSSEAQQTEYIKSLFKAWDSYHDKIEYIGFLWLTDLSEAQAEQFVLDYGGQNTPSYIAFKEYLRTTAFRTYPGEGKDKQGFLQMKKEIKSRSW